MLTASFVQPFIQPVARPRRPRYDSLARLRVCPARCSAGSPFEAGERTPQGVPGNATAAATRLQAATRSAIIAGRRGLFVDVLVEAVRRDARTYDASVHAVIIRALLQALMPCLPDNAPRVAVFVRGSKAALDSRALFHSSSTSNATSDNSSSQQDDNNQDDPFSENKTDSEKLPEVEINVLGSGDISDKCGALVIIEPPARGTAVRDVRHLIRQAGKRHIPVIVLNQPQEDSVHKIAGYAGSIPYEMMNFDTVFMLAPFAIIPADPNLQSRDTRGRFVLFRVFPGEWQLWKHTEQGTEEEETPSTVSQLLDIAQATTTKNTKPDSIISQTKEGYVLSKVWTEKPTEDMIFRAVSRAGQRQVKEQ